MILQLEAKSTLFHRDRYGKEKNVFPSDRIYLHANGQVIFSAINYLQLQSCKIAQKTMKRADPLDSEAEGCSLDQRMASIFCKESDSNGLCHLFILILFCFVLKPFKI